jgi:uncharacterized protein DUF5658
MRHPRLAVVAIILFVELLPVALLRAGEDPGSSSNPTEVRAISEANPAIKARPVQDQSSLSLANDPAKSATGFISNQPLMTKPRSARRSPLLIALYVSHGVLQGLDAQSTLRAIHSGSGREGNPLVSPFASQPAALVGFKVGATAGTIYGIDRLYKSHPRLAMITLAAINGGYAILVQRNYRSFPPR